MQLDPAEFRSLMVKLEIGMSGKDLAQMTKDMDANDDGLVDIGELDALVRLIQRAVIEEKAGGKPGPSKNMDEDFTAPTRDFQ
jgi:hypothetical protein